MKPFPATPVPAGHPSSWPACSSPKHVRTAAPDLRPLRIKAADNQDNHDILSYLSSYPTLIRGVEQLWVTLRVGPPFPVVIHEKRSGARAVVGRRFLEYRSALTLKNVKTAPTL